MFKLNSTKKSILLQLFVILLVILGLYLLRSNTLENLEAQDKSLGFAFLSDTSGFSILPTFGTWVMDYKVGESTYVDVFIVGVLNTIIVGIMGIIAGTILGFLVGIFRLSDNIVLKWFSAVYVEIFRNIPLLLWLFIVYFAVLRTLPDKRDAFFLFDKTFGINITGFYAPSPVFHYNFWFVFIILILIFVVIFFLTKWAKKRFINTGKRFPIFWVNLSLIFIVPIFLFYLLDKPMSWNFPDFKSDGPVLKRGFQTGMGIMIVPEMIAVWAALSLYTSSFIAEIVRSGILAINIGQSEASSALGLKKAVTLRLIVIPQALRVIIPPLTSQYLNLIKNSSLSVAIAYPELVSTFGGTALNQVGKEVEMIFMLMLVYLFFSILTSGFMNWFNAKIKLTER